MKLIPQNLFYVIKPKILDFFLSIPFTMDFDRYLLLGVKKDKKIRRKFDFQSNQKKIVRKQIIDFFIRKSDLYICKKTFQIFLDFFEKFELHPLYHFCKSFDFKYLDSYTVKYCTYSDLICKLYPKMYPNVNKEIVKKSSEKPGILIRLELYRKIVEKMKLSKIEKKIQQKMKKNKQKNTKSNEPPNESFSFSPSKYPRKISYIIQKKLNNNSYQYKFSVNTSQSDFFYYSFINETPNETIEQIYKKYSTLKMKKIPKKSKK